MLDFDITAFLPLWKSQGSPRRLFTTDKSNAFDELLDGVLASSEITQVVVTGQKYTIYTTYYSKW
jgi:hypothetical protein